ncbi:recombinase RecB [Vogesella alkaliphila]|uniref:Recombinase RecB n=1 Tax=Vogesella alkaliphila TaxID=1193621 RepID=A0ABQ2YRG1_9NEIS|nr:recombinase RecB [Vogesella alkaliphila]
MPADQRERLRRVGRRQGLQAAIPLREVAMAVALYARVSTVRQADNDLSIPDQLRQMREWCERQGYVIGHEYVEPGASATDDRRPVLQDMMQEALRSPSPFEAIVVHSLSRFFRDSVSMGLYERKLAKFGVKLISITQMTGDDPAGEMARKIFSVFDEYQSKENGKHTSRAMKENARQGFNNGSQPPYGYCTVEAEATTSRGRHKKRLAVYEPEATVVRQIYALYLHGYQGRPMGMKEIAGHLTKRGLLMRGKPWRMQMVYGVLSKELYVGVRYFNVTQAKTRRRNPPEQWVKQEVDAIIDRATFDDVRALRSARAPSKVAPRMVSSDTLLTGLLKCGHCGAAMTLATGKGGRYRYYKCTNRQNKQNDICDSKNIPMERLDDAVLRFFAEQWLVPERVGGLLTEWRQQLSLRKSGQQDRYAQVQRTLADIEARQARLLDAIESGALPVADLSIRSRLDRLKAEREAQLVELAGIKRVQAVPEKDITPQQIGVFCQVLRDRLQMDKVFAKQYLKVLLRDIRITAAGEAVMSGSYEGLAQTVLKTKRGTESVPSFVRVWRPHGESNPGRRRERAVF